MRRTLVVVAPLLAIVVLVGAWQVFSGDDGSGGKPRLHGTVAFGVLAPFAHAGELGRRARDTSEGARMAAAEINARGGLLGRRVVLAPFDDACSPVLGYEAAKGIVEGSGIAGVLGGICSEAAAREVPVIASGGIPFLVTTANGERVVTPDAASAYLLNGTLYQQALSAVFWMNYRSAQRLAIVGDTSTASRTLNKKVIELIDEAPELVSLQNVPVGQTDLKNVARAALASRPNFVYWTGGASGGGALVRELHALGYKGTFTASAASEAPGFLDTAGPGGAEGAYVLATSRPTNTPTAAGWRRKFEADYGHAPGLEALQAYDAVRTLAQATKQAGTTDTATVSATLPKLSFDFHTFLGVMRFARDHTLLYDNRVVLVVKNDRLVWERSLRTDSLQ